jgi:anti-sigma regulatory factor (Ser/Thr protein kinase)
VSDARRFALNGLPRDQEDVRERVELMVSELAANCVVHAATEFEVVITRTAECVRVEVTDTGDGQPSVRWPGPLQPKGRGLQIVSALADEWGVEPAPDDAAGKTVWFTVRLKTPARMPKRRSRL